MSEEEKKAIEEMKETIDFYNKRIEEDDKLRCVLVSKFDVNILQIILNLIEKKQSIIDKAIDKLKEHKKDLDYEPWSAYKIDGSILFDLADILERNKDK